MLAIEGLTKIYGASAAVRDVSLTIERGSFVGVIGRSGAGKSTLLRMINRLTDPSEGRILFEGGDVTALQGADLRAWRRSCAMIFQQFNLVGRMDVMTNVLTGRLSQASHLRSLLNIWSDNDKAMALSALEQFDMANLAAQRVDQLSGGQQQRVAIARALAMEPKLMLFDEPTSALDPQMVGEVLDVMKALVSDGLTRIVVTHEMAFARDVSSRTVFMKDGIIWEDGAPSQIFGSPEKPETQEFLSRFFDR